MEDKALIDWERIEADYRAGIKTLRQIADENGVTHGAINKRSRRDGWSRDLSAKIAQKAEELVSRSMVSKPVSKQTMDTERDIVASNAEAIVTIRLSQRKDVGRSRALCNALLSELEAQTSDVELFAQLGEMMASPDEKGVDKLNDIYRKVISTPSRIDSAKKLAETMKTLIGLEREAFGIGIETNAGSSLEDVLRKIAAEES